MNPQASRLLLLNGAPAYRRLIGIIAGVAVGVSILTILLGAFVNMADRDSRVAWMTPDGAYNSWDENDDRIVRAPQSDAMLAAYDTDTFGGEIIHIVTVATTRDTTVDFPADLAPLAPGQFYASSALSDLLESTPADQLANRWGEYMGEIPDQAVKGPSHKVVLVGAEWDDMDEWSNAVLQPQFRPVAPTAESVTYRVVLAMGAIALLVPITLFISIVSALGAADRRERFATARLIGAGRKSIALMSGAEMAIASLLGGAIGVGLGAALRPLAAQLSISGATMTIQDLTPSVPWTIVIALGIGLLAGLTAFSRTYRDDVGALGATREREEKPVTMWRTSLLVIGLLAFGGAAWGAQAIPGAAEMLSYLLIAGFGCIAFGIVLAGPWITRVTSQLIGKHSSSAAGVVAAGRLQRHPRATFRSVAGLVVAVFVVSVFAGGSSAVGLSSTARDLPGRMDLDAVTGWVDSTAEADAITEAVTDLDGVEHIAVASSSPEEFDYLALMTPEDARAIGATEVPDAPVVGIYLHGMMTDNGPGSAGTLEVPVAVDASLDGLSATAVVVVTNGQAETIERVKTAMVQVRGTSMPPATRQDLAERGMAGTNEELAVMAYLGMGLAIGISALALIVATAAAVLDRRRTFGLLRLGGMPVSQLRLTTVVEATVPLVVTLLAAAGLGWGIAWGLIEALSADLSVSWPDQRYWWAMTASIAIAALGLVSTFGTVRRSTELASTRFE